jgi:prepilin-type N-terminal cleavage/methylation domain-containing protein
MRIFSRDIIRSSRHAFSLLELMVAVALLAVIIVGLLAMFSQVQRAWKSGITQVDVMEGGRAAMALIVRDLQEITANPASHLSYSLLTNDPPVFVSTNFQAVIEPGSPDILLNQVDGGVRGNTRQTVSFLTRLGDQWTGIAYVVSSNLAGVGTLYRLSASAPSDQSSVAVTAFYQNYPANVNRMTEYVMGARYPFTPQVPAMWPGPDPLYRTNGLARVLDGVVHFTVDAFDTNGVRMVRTEAAGGFICTNFFDASGLNVQMPSYLEVELAVLSITGRHSTSLPPPTTWRKKQDRCTFFGSACPFVPRLPLWICSVPAVDFISSPHEVSLPSESKSGFRPDPDRQEACPTFEVGPNLVPSR